MVYAKKEKGIYKFTSFLFFYYETMRGGDGLVFGGFRKKGDRSLQNRPLGI